MAISKKKNKKIEVPKRSAKEERLYQNLLKTTEQYMSGKGFKGPQTEAEIMKRLGLPEIHQPLMGQILETMKKNGQIEEANGSFSWKMPENSTIIGVLNLHPRGFGFVQPENSSVYLQDIFIPKNFTKNAVDGDKVEVLVNTDYISEKGPEGRIINILSRGRTHIGGIIKAIDTNGELIAHVPLLGAQQRVIVQPAEDRQLQIGDRLVLEVIDWGAKETETLCRMANYIGHISDPSCDISAAIEEYELRCEFPTRVVEEAKEYGTLVSKTEISKREDLRELETFTIDPDTAKDFDDAISLSKDKKGHFHLVVHIADVSHYVKPGTHLDLEAQERCNSTYFPGRCIPMLPSELSDNLCSLKPKVNRLTVSVFMDFDETGEMINYRISKSVIKSQKRFSYKEAKQVLDGKKSSPHAPTLHLMVEMCRLLKRKRYQRGSIEFSLPELVVLVDEKGVPCGTDFIEYDITHQLVEEFMLKANETVATHLSKIGKNLTYRVHDSPAEENLREFSLLAAAFGFKVPDLPTSQDLQKLFEEAANTPMAGYLATNYIRRMRLATYSAENVGHYGLSLTHYCHFTSPIRRYVDLVVHRILFGESDDLEYLQEISTKCSEQERISAKAEGSVTVLKKLRLLKSKYEEEPYREYEAIVSRIKNYGLYFEALDFMLEGFLHISELDDDYFIYEESLMRLKGTRRGKIFGCGDRITVMLKSIDFIALEAKWYITGQEKSERQPVQPSKKRTSAKKPGTKKKTVKRKEAKKSRVKQRKKK